ncbi:MAG: phage tail sheath subtilisin-like domain-containing protein [Methanomicrobiaceae archaeon]|nr:phage tail sheath subtilisin-like domain-containing protein [Methanomicrobiaceae archaeon]
MIGTTEKGQILKPIHVGNYREFAEVFGSGAEYTITNEAKHAFLNGVYEVVVVPIAGKGAEKAKQKLKDQSGADTVLLIAQDPGRSGNKIAFGVEAGSVENTVSIVVTDGGAMEAFENVVMDPKVGNYLVEAINSASSLISAEDLNAKSKAPANNPALLEGSLAGGKDGEVSKDDFEKALEKLEGEPDVDMVLACGVSDPEIHALIDAHCQNMSLDAKNRIGIGTVGVDESLEDICTRTTTLASDRFILVAPAGNAGAVAGLIGKLNYYESPTFKPIAGISKIDVAYTPSELAKLLNAGILPLEAQRGRGIVVVKGITTSKEQISVQRIADRSVRGVKNISDLFIGTLNNEANRIALNAKITEFLMQMEREGSIVPSTDGTEPAFIIDVYSSQSDFAQGIVRIDMAVRPVRAIDYIYATILVEA